MNIDIMEKDELSKQLEYCRSEKSDCLDKNANSSNWFLAGGITGIILSYVVATAVKK